MNTDESRLEANDITEQIIGAAYDVSNVMGCGFLEKVYENALVHEMSRKGLDVIQQHPIEIFYDDKMVGEYVADILVENKVLVELKAVSEFDEVHMAQCLNYLNATSLNLCLLINFGKPKVEIKRIVRDF